MKWRCCWLCLLLPIALAGSQYHPSSLLLLDQGELVNVSVLRQAILRASPEHRRVAREILRRADTAYQDKRYAAASKLYMESACAYPTPQALLGLARSYARDKRDRESPAAEEEARQGALTTARDWLNAAQARAEGDQTMLRMISDERAFQESLARGENQGGGP